MTADEEGFVSTKAEVQIFLREAKDIFNSKNFEFDLAMREDKSIEYTNVNCLATLGYDKDDVIQEIKTLTVANYYETVKDKNNKKYNEYYYIFGKVIQERMVYIKFKIVSRDNKKIFCISFHFPEHEMVKFPYR